MIPLILKRAPIGDNQDDYDVLEDGVVVGRIFVVPTAPEGRPWMWRAATVPTASSAPRTAMSRRATPRWRPLRRAGAARFRFRAKQTLRRHRRMTGSDRCC